MALSELLALNASHNQKKGNMSEQAIKQHLTEFRDAISYFRAYPDMLVDFWVSCIPQEQRAGALHLFFYQRLALRGIMRHRHTYYVFPRAWSKSFISILGLMLRCILYPGSHLFVTTGGKDQAAGILKEKVEELLKLIPGLKNEINWTRGMTRIGKDDITYVFRNGSVLDIIAAKQSSRGKRATGGLIEECILVDDTTLNEVIIPTMNVSRRLPDGSRHDEEKNNKCQIFITTAGFKNSYAYEKHMMTLIEAILNPDESLIMGGTWRVPVLEGLLSKTFVQELKLDGTYNESSFDREYNSVWSGDAENCFFSSQAIDKNRVLLQPENEYSGRTSKNGYYVIAVDVGRVGCLTEAAPIKVTPQVQGSALKSIVNWYTYEAEHFEEQSIALKKLFYKYKARTMVVDANGLGIGLMDFLVKSQIDPETGETLPGFGVIKESDLEDTYKEISKGPDMEKDAIWMIKANPQINTEMYSYTQSQISSGRIKFLIDQREAKVKLMSTKVGMAMSPQAKAEHLRPFTLTTILREQMLNLAEDNDMNRNIILKPVSRKIKHDKVSALCYGLYYIKQQEERKKKRKSRDLSRLQFFN